MTGNQTQKPNPEACWHKIIIKKSLGIKEVNLKPLSTAYIFKKLKC